MLLDDQSTTPLFDAGFAIFHRKADGTVQSLRKPALQHLIEQAIPNRYDVVDPIRVQVLIRFQITIAKLPRQSRSPTTVPSVIGGQRDNESDHQESPAGFSGTRSSAVQQEDSTASSAEQDRVTAPPLGFAGPPLLDNIVEDAQETPISDHNTTTGAHFRGPPVLISMPILFVNPKR